MDIFQTHYTRGKGWHDELPDLDSSQTLVLVFGSADNSMLYKSFKDINEQYPNSIIAGCSTPAGILANEVVLEGLVISITRFCDTRLSIVDREKEENTSAELGSSIANDLKEESLVGVLTFADGKVVNGSQYLQGLNQILTNEVVVTGGLAANSGEQSKSWVVKEGWPCKEAASAIGFYGTSVSFLSGKGSGWKPFGIKRVVTKAEKQNIYEFDGKPALKLYKDYLGDAAKGLPKTGLLYPLMILSENPEDNMIRSIMKVNEHKQSITFAGDIPQGVSAQLMYGSFEGLIEGAEKAVDSLAKINTHSDGVLSIVTSCIGRLMVLDEDVEIEVDVVLNKLVKKSQNIQQIGFYSAGEFATLSKGACALHNETLTLTVIYEK